MNMDLSSVDIAALTAEIKRREALRSSERVLQEGLTTFGEPRALKRKAPKAPCQSPAPKASRSLLQRTPPRVEVRPLESIPEDALPVVSVSSCSSSSAFKPISALDVIEVDQEEDLPAQQELKADKPQDLYVRGQAFCFTHWYHEVEGDCCEKHPALQEYFTQRLKTAGSGYQVQLVGVGVEEGKTGKDTGRKHFQGFVVFNKSIQFKTLKGLFCEQIHWSKMLGTVEQNRQYCKKEGTYVELGDPTVVNPHPRSGCGVRNDLAQIKESVDTGATLAVIADKHFESFVKFSNGITKAHMLLQKDDRLYNPRKREFIVLWGPPGTGKSWWARKHIGEQSFCEPGSNNSGKISFDTYSNQEWLLLEDFAPESLAVCELKRITDMYTVKLPARGTEKMGVHNGVIITCNYNPKLWYTGAGSTEWDALERRATQVWHCGKTEWEDMKTGQVIPTPLPAEFRS